MGSKKYTLDTTDLMKIVKGALIVVSGSLLTYLSEVVVNVDFGEYTTMIAGILMILINAGLKWVRENEE